MNNKRQLSPPTTQSGELKKRKMDDSSMTTTTTTQSTSSLEMVPKLLFKRKIRSKSEMSLIQSCKSKLFSPFHIFIIDSPWWSVSTTSLASSLSSSSSSSPVHFLERLISQNQAASVMTSPQFNRFYELMREFYDWKIKGDSSSTTAPTSDSKFLIVCLDSVYQSKQLHQMLFNNNSKNDSNDSNDSKNENVMLKKIVSMGVPIVHEQFIYDSIEDRKLKHLNDYRLVVVVVAVSTTTSALTTDHEKSKESESQVNMKLEFRETTMSDNDDSSSSLTSLSPPQKQQEPQEEHQQRQQHGDEQSDSHIFTTYSHESLLKQQFGTMWKRTTITRTFHNQQLISSSTCIKHPTESPSLFPNVTFHIVHNNLIHNNNNNNNNHTHNNNNINDHNHHSENKYVETEDLFETNAAICGSRCLHFKQLIQSAYDQQQLEKQQQQQQQQHRKKSSSLNPQVLLHIRIPSTIISADLFEHVMHFTCTSEFSSKLNSVFDALKLYHYVRSIGYQSAQIALLKFFALNADKLLMSCNTSNTLKKVNRHDDKNNNNSNSSNGSSGNVDHVDNHESNGTMMMMDMDVDVDEDDSNKSSVTQNMVQFYEQLRCIYVNDLEDNKLHTVPNKSAIITSMEALLRLLQDVLCSDMTCLLSSDAFYKCSKRTVSKLLKDGDTTMSETAIFIQLNLWGAQQLLNDIHKKNNDSDRDGDIDNDSDDDSASLNVTIITEGSELANVLNLTSKTSFVSNDQKRWLVFEKGDKFCIVDQKQSPTIAYRFETSALRSKIKFALGDVRFETMPHHANYEVIWPLNIFDSEALVGLGHAQYKWSKEEDYHMPLCDKPDNVRRESRTIDTQKLMKAEMALIDYCATNLQRDRDVTEAQKAKQKKIDEILASALSRPLPPVQELSNKPFATLTIKKILPVKSAVSEDTTKARVESNDVNMTKQASSSSTPVNKTTTSSASNSVSTGTTSITTNGQKKNTGTNEGNDIGIMSQLLRISSSITQQTPVQLQWLQPSAKWKSTFPPEGFSQQENQSVWHQYETVLVSDLDNIRRGFREFSFLGTKWRLNIQTKPKDKSTLSIYLYNVDIEQKKKLSHEVHTKIAFYVYNLEKKTKTLMQAFNIKWLEEKAWGFTSFANINQLKAKENHLIDESNNTITFCCSIISNPEENSTPTKK